MSTSALKIEPMRTRKTEIWVVAAGIALLAPALLMVCGTHVLLGGVWFAGAAAIVLLVNPRWAFILLIPAVGWYHPMAAGPVQVQLSDALTLLAAFGAVLEWLWRVRTRVVVTPFDVPFLALMLATWWSIPFAYSYAMTVTPALRIIFIYIAYRLVLTYSVQIGLGRVVRYYVVVVALLSVRNIVEFIIIGGSQRIFGLSWLTFESLSMTALPMAAAFMIYAGSWKRGVAWAGVCLVIGAAIIASGSRGTMLAVALGVPVLVWASARGRGSIRSGSILKIVTPLALLIGVTVLLRDSLLAYPVERIEQMFESVSGAQGSIALRLVLWTAAIKAFAAHPLTGIGIGNFRVVDLALPTQHMGSVWYYIRGMSAHNSFLHYLAETGVPGAVALAFLCWRGVRIAVGLQRKLTPSGTGTAIFMGMAVFSVSIFFMRAWTWGQDSYVMALVIGLNAAWWRQHQSSA
ncbi:MAG: O-antigen ligase family protein [bacterium]